MPPWQRVIVKGETTVADIGAGTGFLGFLAAKLGAKRVDLYEAAEVAGVARKLLRHNRLRNCRIFEMHSTEVVEPDRVDVIVCETLGNYPFEENIVETLNDARERFLKPGGTIIPAAVEQFVCPVVSERFFAELAAWDERRLRPRFRPGQDHDAQQHLRAHLRGRRSAGGGRGGQGRGTSLPSTATTRPRGPARRAGP